MDTLRVDALVLGTGPAGGLIARMLHEAGKTVAMTDADGYGGTCPLRGCEPKKLLVDTSDVVTKRRDMVDNGFTGEIGLDWAKLMQYKRSFTDPLPAKIKSYYSRLGITALQGTGVFTGPNTVQVGDTEVTAEHICIATGATPRTLGIEGEELLSTSDDFLELNNLPDRIVFIGAGFIAFEFAHVAAIAGVNTSIVYRGDRLLRKFDPDLKDSLVERTKELGVDILLNSPPQRVEKTPDGLLLHFAHGRSIAADMIVNGAGRVPAIAELNLEAAGIHATRGIVVNDFMQSVDNPNIYAAGDVVSGGKPLTTTAVMEAQIVVHNILHGNSKTPDYSVEPAALFTHPPLATVGLLEEEAKAAGLVYNVLAGDASGWSEMKRIGERHAGYKILVERESGVVIGAHFLGHGAEEIINIISLAMRTRVPFAELQNMLWAYPSFGYTMRYMK